MHAKIWALLFPLLAIANPLPKRSSPVDTSKVTIDTVVYSGTGCPAGSVSKTLTPDNTTVTLIFSNFQAQIGPGIDPDQHTADCELSLSLNYPSGFQVSLVKSTYHGFAQMDPGVLGTFLTYYFFSEQADQTTETSMNISTAGDPGVETGEIYTKEDDIDTDSVVWSPCGETGILNFNNRISLTNPGNSSASGHLTDDDATIQFQQILQFQWQTCDNSSLSSNSSTSSSTSTTSSSTFTRSTSTSTTPSSMAAWSSYKRDMDFPNAPDFQSSEIWEDFASEIESSLEYK